MAAVPGGPRSDPPAGARFFCTAGRGLEPFLTREVRARLAATQVGDSDVGASSNTQLMIENILHIV